MVRSYKSKNNKPSEQMNGTREAKHLKLYGQTNECEKSSNTRVEIQTDEH